MYNKRWYDQEPTIAKAVERLITADLNDRKQILYEIEDLIANEYPQAEEKQARELYNMKFIHQRMTMDPMDWIIVERLKYLEADARLTLAQYIIRSIEERKVR